MNTNGIAEKFWSYHRAAAARNPAADIYAGYPAPRPLVPSLVAPEDRALLAASARAVSEAADDEGDSETSALWAERAQEWERA